MPVPERVLADLATGEKEADRVLLTAVVDLVPGYDTGWPKVWPVEKEHGPLVWIGIHHSLRTFPWHAVQSWPFVRG